MQILTLDDGERWDRAVRAVRGWDVYWLSGYARFWEANGDGAARLALLDGPGGQVLKLFLIRKIDGTGYCDITTPYGYGGYLATPGAASLVEAFDTAFARVCAANGIISEFVRFHPLKGNQTAGAVPVGETVYLDLAEAPGAGYKPEVRNRIRKAQKAGLTVRLTPGPDDIAAFVRLYRATMDRVGARPYYQFADRAFAGLTGTLPDHLLLGEVLDGDQVIAAALFLFNETYLHYHLGGSDADWLTLAPNNLLFDAAAQWGRERGIRLMHLGGGVRPGDSLLRFKATFSPYRASFCVGRRIIDAVAYERLTAAHRRRTGGRAVPDYFPAYRAPAPGGDGR